VARHDEAGAGGVSAILDAPPANTEEWLAWRKGGLGASELPAILGLDPYRSEHDVWLVKTGRAPDFRGNAKTRWGHRLEEAGIEVWSQANAGDWPGAGKAYTKEPYPHLWATPDAVSQFGIGIEVKVTNAWDTPPERVRVQCLAQAGLADLDRVDVVRLSFEDDPAIFRVERDEAAIEGILAAGEAWYVTHVLGDLEPPRRDDVAPADPRQEQLAADLRRVIGAREALERRERAIKDDLIASVAGKGVITGAGFRIEVRAAHDVTRVGWKELASGLTKGMADDEREALLGLHSTTSRTRPSVHPTWDEED